MNAAFDSAAQKLQKGAFCGLLAVGLAIFGSQITCAEVQGSDWSDSDSRRDGGLGQADGDGTWHCFTGTALTEEQFLNRCTDAERIERPSHIPQSVWDGKSPLP